MNPLTLNYSDNSDVVLSVALRDYFIDGQLPTALSLIIEVAAGVTVNLVDDLTCINSGTTIVRHNITINAH